MRLKTTVRVQAFLDAAMKRAMFNDDATLSQTQTDGYAKQANSVLSIVAGATETLSFGDVTAVKGIYLEVDKEAIVVLNGGDPIQMRMADGATTAKLFLEADLSAVTVENTEVTDVLTGFYCIWGDAIA